MADKESDERFSKVFSDPRFRTLRKTDKTLKIDNRFKSLFTEDKFKLRYSMDKRGKSKKHLISEDYKKFYRLSDDEGDNVDLENDDVKNDIDNSDDVEGKLDQEEHPGSNLPESKLTHKFGYHRGIDHADDDDSSSSSSSSDSEESDDENEQELEHEWGDLDKDAAEIDHATARIAICNADWDRINAQDLYVLLTSFKRPTGAIHSVAIYYSKFGEERLKVEEAKGPSEFIFGKKQNLNESENKNSLQKSKHDKEDEDNEGQTDSDVSNASDEQEEEEKEEEEEEEEGEDKDDYDDEGDVKDSIAMEKLRKYQLERMKYFYAVAEFDSAETAEAICNELDGMEYESSSTTLDIRYIPEDMNFDDVKLKEECTSMPNSNNYSAPSFINTALQQSKVKLTWDETDPKRKNAFEKAFELEKEDDLKAYLASSDDDDLDEEEDIHINDDMKDREKIDKYKDLLKSLDSNKDDDVEMEVTWDPSLKSTTEDLVNKREPNSKLNPSKKGKSDEKTIIMSDSESVDDNLEINDLVSDSEEEKVAKSGKSKDRFKKWKNKKFASKKNSNDDQIGEDSSKLELLMIDSLENNEQKKHFNYKEIVDQYHKKESKARNSSSEHKDTFKFDANDPRFSAIYTSHFYNVDQSDPNFKKTEAFNQIINRRKEQASQMINEDSGSCKQELPKPQNKNKAWTSLVRKVKDKTGEVHDRKRQLDGKTNQETRYNTNKKFRR